MTRESIGYARVSTRDQNPASQQDALHRVGCNRIFVDRASGVRSSRPEWDRAISHLRSGDQLVVTRLDRAGRSVAHLVGLVADLHSRGVELRVIEQGVDTTTAAGRMFFHVLAAVSEFEHDLIVERVHDGLTAARARGRTGGRPAKLSESARRDVQRLYDEREMTVAEIAAMKKCSRASVYRCLRRDLGDHLSRRNIQRIRQLHIHESWPTERIAADMGVSVGLVQRALTLDALWREGST